MDLSDPIVAPEGQIDTKNTEPSNEKTEEVIHRLEGEIDQAYSSIEAKFQTLWTNASKNAHDVLEKLKLDEKKAALVAQLNTAKENINNSKLVQDNVQSVDAQLKEIGEQVKGLEKKIDFASLSSQANSALDSLDSGLEYVEKQAGKYVSQFSSFFSSIVSVEPEETPKDAEPETLFTNPKFLGGNYGSTRFDSELFKLHTTESLLLDSSKDTEEKFDVESKTNEIADLLKQYPDTLEKLMHKLVPVELSYDTFWKRYFRLEDEIRANEQKRKELLSKKEKTEAEDEEGDEDDDEDFTWDDDEEEDDDVVKVERVPEGRETEA